MVCPHWESGVDAHQLKRICSAAPNKGLDLTRSRYSDHRAFAQARARQTRTMWITWKHEDTDFTASLTFEQKVDVFYEQTLGWQLHIADLVANGGTTFGEFKLGKAGYAVPRIRHSGFAVLHICFSYIELVGSLVQATRNSSTKTFEAGLRAIPGLIDASQISKTVIDRLFEAARCGLYHEGRTRPGVGLGQPSDGNAIVFDPRSGTIGISPERLPQVLKAHLEQFRLELLDTTKAEIRDRFRQRFDSGFTDPPPNKALQRTSRRARPQKSKRAKPARG